MPRELKVFLSSPGDVETERNTVDRVLTELARSPAWQGKVTFRIIRWDDPVAAPAMDAKVGPQDALNAVLPTPSVCDVTIVVLWSRLGTPLKDQKPDGRRYSSGTEWEFRDALTGKGPVYLFRNLSVPQIPLDDPRFEERRTQYQAVRDFFGSLKDADGANLHSYREYSAPQDFEEKIAQTIEGYLRVLDERGDLVPPPAGAVDPTVVELLKGVERVDDYKAAHDQLHRLQFEGLNQIEGHIGRLSDDPERWEELAEIVLLVDDVVGQIEVLETRLATRQGFKVAPFKECAELLRNGVLLRDEKKVAECWKNMTSLLRRYPSQIVVEMNDAAQRVTTELAALRGRQPSAVIEKVEKRLADLIRDHDRWQRLDFALATATAQSLEFWWPTVQDLAEQLVKGSTDSRFAPVRVAFEEVEQSVAGNAEGMPSKVTALRKRTAVTFNRVDRELKTYCTELRRVDGELGILRPA